MHSVEAIGAIAMSGGVTVAVISGFVLYLAAHGVQPVPDPMPSGAPKRADRDAHFQRYNARYIAVTRVVFRSAAVAGVIGLIVFIVGVVGS